MVFAPFGRVVRGNFRAAEARQGGSRIREELEEPRKMPEVPESVRRCRRDFLFVLFFAVRFGLSECLFVWIGA